MSQLEAWIVTLLGMGVVFVGLLLCISSIQLFNRLAKHITWGEEGHGHGAPAPASTPTLAAPMPEPTPESPALDPQLLAVIAAVLEIEYRLYYGRGSQRLTIRRVTPATQA